MASPYAGLFYERQAAIQIEIHEALVAVAVVIRVAGSGRD